MRVLWWRDRQRAKVRELERKLRDLQWSPTVDASEARKNIKHIKRVRGRVTDEYVDTFVVDWLAAAKRKHDTVGVDLRLLAAHVEEIRTGFGIRLDHQEDVVSDLKAAVAHAWDRISDPDSPFFEPRTRRMDGGRP
ncbi:hypothetical protein [Kutzneria sp. 744]|uniref:hypothetical protein n=1 Tax=Kutzneria sp. (strain 744) TaxID=345341 RepID=UPI0003EEA5CE|nr:hypothetical protein [Kutzneria sp. 744]EWM12183.1 hypothetical protein KUTG_02487 [Kutzneria sp. 744]